MFIVNFLASPFGRLNRVSWWTVQLINLFLIGAAMCAMLAPLMAASETTLAQLEAGQTNLPLLINVAFMPVIWVGVCSSVKRYHDRGKTGFWYFIALVPIIGPIWQLVELGFLPGEDGANAHGPQPRGGVGMASPAASDKPSAPPVWSSDNKPALAPRRKADDRSTAPRETFGLRGA